MARLAWPGVSVRGSPARSATSLHAPGIRTRSSPYEGRVSSIRVNTASTRGTVRYFRPKMHPLEGRTIRHGNLALQHHWLIVLGGGFYGRGRWF